MRPIMIRSFLSTAQRKSLVHGGSNCGVKMANVIDIKCQRIQGHRGLHISRLIGNGGTTSAKWWPEKGSIEAAKEERS